MDSSTIDECFRTLHLGRGVRDDFKDGLIEGLETDQTYRRDLLEISEKDICTYAIDFWMFDDNLASWWPEWDAEKCRAWVNTNVTNLEQALITLFKYWAQSKRDALQRGSLFDGKGHRPKSSKTRVAVKKSTNARHSPTKSLSSDLDLDERACVDADTGAPSTQRPFPSQARHISNRPTTPQPSSGTLPDVVYNDGDDDPDDDEDAFFDDMDDSLPNVSDLLNSNFQFPPRRTSHTIEPQSPLKPDKGKQPDRPARPHPDASYVVSQASTIGQPPISPPISKYTSKRKTVSTADEDEDEEPIHSPTKRNRPTRQQILDPLEETEAETEPARELSQLLMQISSQESEFLGGNTPTSTSTPSHQQGQDLFIDLSTSLHVYLRDCKENNLRRANDPTISPRDKEKLHMRAGILELLYCDVVSRIKAIAARRNGDDKSEKVTCHTLYS